MSGNPQSLVSDGEEPSVQGATAEQTSSASFIRKNTVFALGRNMLNPRHPAESVVSDFTF
jgi:hypothetical protein